MSRFGLIEQTDANSYVGAVYVGLVYVESSTTETAGPRLSASSLISWLSCRRSVGWHVSPFPLQLLGRPSLALTSALAQCWSHFSANTALRPSTLTSKQMTARTAIDMPITLAVSPGRCAAPHYFLSRRHTAPQPLSLQIAARRLSSLRRPPATLLSAARLHQPPLLARPTSNTRCHDDESADPSPQVC